MVEGHGRQVFRFHSERPDIRQNTVRFFRGNRSVMDLVEMSKIDFVLARDESKDVNKEIQMSFIDDLDVSNGCSESCEPF